MKHRPILMSAPMVRAILDGLKTQTRRVVKLSDNVDWQIVDRWHVGEYAGYGIKGGHVPLNKHGGIATRAFDEHHIVCPYGAPGDRLWVRETWQDIGCEDRNEYIYLATVEDGHHPPTWRPSIHMPRWASRLTLEVVKVRVERLADISECDAKSEGYASSNEFLGAPWACSVGPNQWVWVVEFRRVDQ